MKIILVFTISFYYYRAFFKFFLKILRTIYQWFLNLIRLKTSKLFKMTAILLNFHYTLTIKIGLVALNFIWMSINFILTIFINHYWALVKFYLKINRTIFQWFLNLIRLKTPKFFKMTAILFNFHYFYALKFNLVAFNFVFMKILFIITFLLNQYRALLKFLLKSRRTLFQTFLNLIMFKTLKLFLMTAILLNLHYLLAFKISQIALLQLKRTIFQWFFNLISFKTSKFFLMPAFL
jgi:hypothetical protein